MCTGLIINNGDLYFGRNLDYDFSYGEKIVITPRNYKFNYRYLESDSSHYAIIGIATIIDNYPLYYDGVNEKGLCIAGLNFVSNTKYQKFDPKKVNIASFEIIPLLLSKCQNIKEVKKLINKINVTLDGFNESLKPAELHYLISDKSQSIVLEIRKDGIKLFNNKFGVLTNNPPFEIQSFNVNNYVSLSRKDPKNFFSHKINFNRYSRGMGAIGLPGDLSSESRFIKILFTKLNAIKFENEEENVNQFFHVLLSVEQQKGVCEVKPNEFEFTIYSNCYNASKGKMYYKTYSNSQINVIDMFKENLNTDYLIIYNLLNKENFYCQN